jgi:triacylglycerol esterase/lipase EstA (alpha/beta hydrolase family)
VKCAHQSIAIDEIDRVTSPTCGGIVQMEYYSSTLIFSGIRWTVRHYPTENLETTTQRIKTLSLWKHFDKRKVERRPEPS